MSSISATVRATLCGVRSPAVRAPSPASSRSRRSLSTRAVVSVTTHSTPPTVPSSSSSGWKETSK